MDYAKAQEVLTEMLKKYKNGADTEEYQALEKASQAVGDCLEMGLTGEDD